MEPHALEEFEYLWNGTSRDWVLLRDTEIPKRAKYSVFNRETRELLLIEDEELCQAVCESMLSHGVEVLDSLPPGEVRLEDLTIED